MTPQATTSGAGAIQTPRTQAEVRAVMLQREELQDQLRSLSESQSRLITQRQMSLGDGNTAAAQQFDARLKELNDRIARIEGQKLAADDAIAQALARGVGTTDLPEIPEVPGVPFPGFPGTDLLTGEAVEAARREVRIEYERLMILEGIVIVLLGVVAWRWWFRRAIERVRREFAGTPAGGTRELKDAVDAIAVEVERISENQRFVTRLLSERPAEDAVQRPDASPR